MMIKRISLLFLILATLGACQNSKTDLRTKTPKYIFYFIGDGYGPAQAHLTEIYLAHQKGKVKPDTLLMSRFPAQGTYQTYAENRTITGSAAAGTALSAGHKTSINTICMSHDHAKDYKSIAETFRDKGKKVGIVTSVSIDHATPAVFYAHNPSRHNYYQIAQELPQSQFNYFAGGGFKDPYGLRVSAKADNKSNMGLSSSQKGHSADSLTSIFSLAKQEGYRFVQDRNAFDALKQGDDKVIVFSQRPASGASMPFVIDQNEEDFTLVDFTRKGIELLDNPNGFFMMVEGGKIDWACHANDAATTALEVLQFDQAIGEAYRFYQQHPDETLIVVCSDHETGGLSLGWAGTHYETQYQLLNSQKCSNEVFTKEVEKIKAQNLKDAYKALYPLLQKYFGFDTSEALKLEDWEIKALKKALASYWHQGKLSYMSDMERECAYGSYNPVAIEATRILSHKAGIAWTTFSHTALPCPARAIGVGAEDFYGAYDNTDLPKKILEICNQ